MSVELGWARLWATADSDLAPRMRRGAWYPILHDRGTKNLVLKTPQTDVRIGRHLVEIRRRRPERFTVVYRAGSDNNPAKGTSNDLGKTYAVCPRCRTRTRVFAQPTHLECLRCGHRGTVAWWETG